MRTHLMPYVRDIARELRDRAPLTASVTRVCALQRESSLGPEEFVARMQAARRITQERSHAIRDRGVDGLAHKFAYWCEVLRDQCGLRADAITGDGRVPAVTPPAPPAPAADALSAEKTLPSCPMRGTYPRTEEARTALYAALGRFGVHDAGAFIRRYGFGPFGDYEGALARALAWERQSGELRYAKRE